MKTPKAKEEPNVKILVVGLDGATFKLIKTWLEAGKLPFLSKLMADGAYGNLETVFPVLSPIEWACFYTGKNPAKLGVFALSFIDEVRYASQMNASDINSLTLWGILSRYGKRVGVVNIPSTYPPEPVNGFMISGFLTPTSRNDYFYPSEIGEYMSDYEIDVKFHKFGDLPYEDVDKYGVLSKLYDIMEKRAASVSSLLRRYNVDFYATNFKEVDTLQHLFWDKPKIMLTFYKKVDRYVEQLYNLIEPNYVFVVSDHGFHEAEKYYFNINTWLEKKGYLKRSASIKANLITLLYSIGIRLGRFGFVRRLIPTQIKDKAGGEMVSHQINFKASRIYASQHGVFISKELIEKSDYITFRERLKTELKNIRNPKTGKKVFKYLLRREEQYHGKKVKDFPDLILVPEPDYIVNPNLSDKLFDRRIHRMYLTGAHKSDNQGIFIAWGENVKKGHETSGSRLIDIAPTIMYLFGIPIPTDVDGKVLEDAFEKDFLRKNPIRHRKIREGLSFAKRKVLYTRKEKDELKERLRELGYIS